MLKASLLPAAAPPRAACLAMILAVPLSGYAQLPSRSDRDKPGSGRKSAAPDEKFVKKAARDNKAEADLGRLASKRGASDAVKQFGQRMATDHGKAAEELAQLASRRASCLRQMVRDHDAGVKAFEREAQRAKDPDVRAWVEKTLPVLKEHQQQAKSSAGSASPRSAK
jgi:putative membrane protein